MSGPSKVNQLAYVGAGTTDLPAWRAHAEDVLGAEVMSESDEAVLFLRIDERHHRLMIRAADIDDVTFVGWEVTDARALAAASVALEAAGVAVEAGTPEEASERRVLDFVQFTCPHTGVRMEVAYGHEEIFTPRFRASQDVSGFRTGDQGLGHVVLYVDDARAAAEFYVEALGFGVSDYVVVGGIGPVAAFLHCNTRHHSLAFIANPSAPRRIQHVMLETLSIDDVGLAYDRCLTREITTTSLGRHNNDRAFSFYFRNPSGWNFEFAWAPRSIDPSTWIAEHYAPSGPGAYWGHKGLRRML